MYPAKQLGRVLDPTFRLGHVLIFKIKETNKCSKYSRFCRFEAWVQFGISSAKLLVRSRGISSAKLLVWSKSILSTKLLVRSKILKISQACKFLYQVQDLRYRKSLDQEICGKKEDLEIIWGRGGGGVGSKVVRESRRVDIRNSSILVQCQNIPPPSFPPISRVLIRHVQTLCT